MRELTIGLNIPSKYFEGFYIHHGLTAYELFFGNNSEEAGQWSDLIKYDTVLIEPHLTGMSMIVSSPALHKMDLPHTLPDLLRARAVVQNAPQLTFLGVDGSIFKSISYADLLDIATVYAGRLLAAGLTRSDIVLAGFTDHVSQVYLFWACCLAGIPVCPLPALHPDPSRQSILFNHLQSLFHKPTLVASTETIKEVHSVVPELKALIPEELPVLEASAFNRIFPARRPSPNDTVCFMLTSGSTGNSKAVLLRHSNLLASIRGKIRHHGTTAGSRFLNWISFDHVACVSEVHLHALEVNARSV
jgi:acyl-CoA synthetase (AMP-forming)/AMP-acid ligase II